MDQLDKGGFCLFPMPPTPPANRPRFKPWTADQHRLSQRNSDLPQLRPAPLKLRKKKLVTPSQPSTTASALRALTVPDDAVAPAVRGFTPTGPLEHVPTHEGPLTALPDVVEEPEEPGLPEVKIDAAPDSVPEAVLDDVPDVPAPSGAATLSPAATPVATKRTSYRRSRWLDGNGQLDRKTLSVYLSDSLDPSFDFDVAGDLTTQSPSLDTLKRTFPVRTSSHVPPSWRFSRVWNASQPAYAPEMPSPVECRCPPGVVICQCHSSPEFEHFRRGQADHKTNASVSSTMCLLAVPRARFHTNLHAVDEVDPPLSPPGLSYDSEESDDLDWSLPSSPASDSRRAVYQQTPTPLPRPRNLPTARPPVPSFSLPFSHGKQIRPRFQADKAADLAWDHPSPSSTIPTLASISTVSTFTFEFGADDMTECDDVFEEGTDVSEIRTWEPIQKAKPVLVHCRGPSPQTLKYGHDIRHKKARRNQSISSMDIFALRS